MTAPKPQWKTFLGIERYKIDFWFKKFLYQTFGIKLPKLKSQLEYWRHRGEAYCDEIMSSGYLDREVFFQNLIMDELGRLEFDSAFEAGCGFGWNVRRIKELYPQARVGGLDFSLTQLQSGRRYMAGYDVGCARGDACLMPFEDNAFDVGFSLGVFMNIHPNLIMTALSEMARVCGKYIMHMEYVEKYATKELVERRAFKTNIISHDYEALYAKLGLKASKVLTHEDFGEALRKHEKKLNQPLDRWEGFEGPDKYTFYVFET